MKIAIVVHGRFHAFDLVRALIKRGDDVTVFTNYPRWAVARFGVPAERVHSFTLHGLLSRLAGPIQEKTGWLLDRWTHPLFARWARRELRRDSWDVIHAWTGVSEEIYADPAFRNTLKLDKNAYRFAPPTFASDRASAPGRGRVRDTPVGHHPVRHDRAADQAAGSRQDAGLGTGHPQEHTAQQGTSGTYPPATNARPAWSCPDRRPPRTGGG